MSTIATVDSTARTHADTALRRAVRLYTLEVITELRKVWRMPAFSIPALAFPGAFYLFFGVALGEQQAGPVTVATYLIATYGAFGVLGASLFNFGVGVAVERGQGWMSLKRATPMPPTAYFAAKTVVALVFSAAVVALLVLLGTTVGGVRLPLSTWVPLVTTLIAGSIPFCALGLLLGYLASPNSAPGVVNLIYLPMSFLSGLWIPVQALPAPLQTLATFLPPYHYAQLALRTFGGDRGGDPLLHLTVLVAFTAACLAGARWAYRRDESRAYG